MKRIAPKPPYEVWEVPFTAYSLYRYKVVHKRYKGDYDRALCLCKSYSTAYRIASALNREAAKK